MAAVISPSIAAMAYDSFGNYSANNTSTIDVPPYRQSAILTTIGSHTWLVTSVIFLLTVAWQVFHYFFIHDRPPKGLKRLPGPLSTLPWLGRVHDIPPDGPWFAWRKILEDPKYNGIAASTICGEMHVWIGDLELARDFLIKKAKIYSSRPEVPAVPGSDSQHQYLPLMRRDGKLSSQRPMD